MFVYPWTADQGDGTYRNPVLCADYSDPDIVRHGDDFWMTASSFNCTPGLPILHSRDLVNWTLAGHALAKVPGERYDRVQPGCGVWAPAIRFHAGKFWIFFPTPDEGIYVTTASDPRGPWSEPHLLHAGKGLIDPCPLWDDDGQAYLVHAYAGSRAGVKHRLCVCPMAANGSRLLGEGRTVFHEPERQPTIEGPKFLKREGWYYILAPAGGVATGWQTVLRSRNVYGPYEDRVVLHQGHTKVNGPHQGALVDTPQGEWWFLHFQDAGVYGRVVHLQPVEWRDSWPLMGMLNGGVKAGEPVLQHAKPRLPVAPIAAPATSDEFTSSQLGPQWQWPANPQPNWHSLSDRPGWLRLFAQPHSQLGHAPNVLLQKWPARQFSVLTSVDVGGGGIGMEAGLAVVGATAAALGLRRTPAGAEVFFRAARERIVANGAGPTLTLRVVVKDGGECEFSFSQAPGEWTVVPEKFQAQAGIWIGAKVGLYALGQGHADFDYFRFTP